MKRATITFLLFFTLFLNGQTVRGVWENKAPKIGDVTAVDFDFGRIDGSFYVEGLPPKGSDFGDFRVISSESVKDERGDGIAKLTVAVFGSGELKPPALKLKMLTEKGETAYDGLIDPLTVQKRLTGSEPMPAIAGPIAIPKPFPVGLLLAGIIALTAIVALAVFLLRKKTIKAPEAEKISVERSPDEWIILRLKSYIVKNLLSLRDYADISYDIRLYLEKRTEVKALESTTSELGEVFTEEQKLRVLRVRNFISIFTFCDYVKFAKHFPDAGEENEFKTCLREFVKEVEAGMREEKKAA
jgi:hypothetical protein